jgi:hypothetical protein
MDGVVCESKKETQDMMQKFKKMMVLKENLWALS